eukprot:CAMPEP_0113953476 /NCGR_PEP_ID=MMETSP1339-20121228/90993_1 /TAXON_ID=94617 /ORGANISM="Fibrocapsa japonica" /LENGTH=77 /DNA_ID=CAMNT_0000962207 /DNA_START=376 /DNA_END=609 /DNA_ORIENTATION=- /assembly_acc=CAM_ASM_000762
MEFLAMYGLVSANNINSCLAPVFLYSLHAGLVANKPGTVEIDLACNGIKRGQRQQMVEFWSALPQEFQGDNSQPVDN